MNNIKQISLSKNDFIVEYDTSSLKLNYIDDKDRYIIDISKMNLLNATKVAILCSTYCFIKDFKKKICWIVKDEETKRAISILRLKNTQQFVKEQYVEKKAVFA